MSPLSNSTESNLSAEVLMYLGVALFVILTIVLFMMVSRKQNVAVLLPFFLLPIVMIGFSRIHDIHGPGIELNFNDIQAELAEVRQNPHDQAARERLNTTLAKVDMANPSTLTSQQSAIIAKAHLLLGQKTQALRWADTAVKKDPQSPAARQTLQGAQRLQAHPQSSAGQP